MRPSFKLSVVCLFTFIFFLNHSLQARDLPAALIDDVSGRALKAFDVPGLAVAVVKDGRIIHAKGYGVRSLKNRKPVTANTLFGIASNSKAFTTACLAILVDQGELDWDDRVIDYIPDFRLYNPYVTEDFRIRDLLTHRSGLGLGAGDLMFFPDSTNFTLQDLIHNLRYLKQVSPFRSQYAYDNLLYMVAGEIVHRVSGLRWEEFVEARIMRPLGMKRSAASFERLTDRSDIIDGHAPVDGLVKVIRRHHFMDGENAAGGIWSNVNELSKWVLARLNNGKYGPDLSDSLFSTRASREMWAPQTIVPGRADSIYHTHFRAYGLGWFLKDVAGYLEVSHTGGLEGMVTQITLFPELHLGIIVLTNQQSGAAFRSVTNTIKDFYLGLKTRDWVNIYSRRVGRRKARADSLVASIWKEINQATESSTTEADLSGFPGLYEDPWFGQIEIARTMDGLRFRSLRSPKLVGSMYHYKANTFIVKWDNRNFDADAFVMFHSDGLGHPVRVTMKAISPLTDFSYDFHDLDFRRINQ